MDLSLQLRDELQRHGADLIGFGDLTALPIESRQGLPTGVAVAVKLPKEAMRGIADLPTQAYYRQYSLLNDLLDGIVGAGAALLRQAGYRAVAQTRQYVNPFMVNNITLLPHKTVSTRAGLGWIGKSALLVTPEYGSMVRISSLLTDAPLPCAAPVEESRCGACEVCMRACPGGAISGRLWRAGLPREAFFDARACEETTLARSLAGFGQAATLCGKCIVVCPWTKKYLDVD
jgi:epoxyqueuosine reductase QueG